MTLESLHLILPEIPRLYTAIAEWLACMICIITMKKRIRGWRLAAVCVGMLVIQSVFMVLTDPLEGVWWFLCMAAAIAMMDLFILGCCCLTGKDAGYCCVRAFILAEFMASLEWEVECFFYYDMNWKLPWCSIFWLIVTYGLISLFFFFLDRKYGNKDLELDVEAKELIPYILIGLMIFLLSNLSYSSLKTPFTGTYYPEIFNMRTFTDLGGLAILYAYHIQRTQLRTRYELDSIQHILHNQYVQYQKSQEAIDIINYKYHDLKHHMIALQASGNMDSAQEYLEKLEEDIQGYTAQSNTGNQVLDTLLTSKNLYCMKNHVTLTSVVDGNLFDFMDTMDICSIFGNALDNAIECAIKIPDEEKRLVHVEAYAQKKLLLIRFENYYEEKLKFNQELPQTTKKEKEFHGYGLKSLRHTVYKYNGEVDITAEENWFRLEILIPMKMK